MARMSIKDKVRGKPTVEDITQQYAKTEEYFDELDRAQRLSKQSSDQTRIASLIEVCISVLLGFGASLAYWPIVGERYDIDYTIGRHIGITIEFTILSIARQYVVRRFWARRMHEAAARWAMRLVR
jgi:hypothetical protein